MLSSTFFNRDTYGATSTVSVTVACTCMFPDSIGVAGAALAAIARIAGRIACGSPSSAESTRTTFSPKATAMASALACALLGRFPQRLGAHGSLVSKQKLELAHVVGAGLRRRVDYLAYIRQIVRRDFHGVRCGVAAEHRLPAILRIRKIGRQRIAAGVNLRGAAQRVAKRRHHGLGLRCVLCRRGLRCARLRNHADGKPGAIRFCGNRGLARRADIRVRGRIELLRSCKRRWP